MRAWCMHHGVPFDVAHALDDIELLAYSIVFSQFENGSNLEWSWDIMEFIERR
jgi:hypothetical protein